MAELTGGFDTDADSDIEFEIPLLYLYQNAGTRTSVEFVYAYDDGGVRYSVYEALASFPAPINLLASDSGAGAVSLTWDDESETEDRFRLERKLTSEGSSGWDHLDDVGENTTSYTDDGSGNLSAPGAESYDYRARAERDDSQGLTTSDWSNTATIDLTTVAPTMVGISNVTASEISVEFTDESDNEVEFEVGRDNIAFAGDTQDPDNVIGRINSTTQSGTGTNYTYTDPIDNDAGAVNAEEGVVYDYVVRAVTEDGPGPWSGQSRDVELLPNQVTDLAVSNSVTDQLNLSWTDLVGENHYDIRRRVNGGSWTIIDNNVPDGTESYTDTNVNSSDDYEYEVRGANTEGTGAWSNTAGPISPVSSANPENLIPVGDATTAPGFSESDGDGDYYDEIDDAPGGSLDGNTVSISASNCNTNVESQRYDMENSSEPHSTSQTYTVQASTGGIGSGSVAVGLRDTVAGVTEKGSPPYTLSQSFVDTLIGNSNLDQAELVLEMSANSDCTSNCGEEFEVCDIPSRTCDRLYLEITN